MQYALITAKAGMQEIIFFRFSSRFLFLVITSCGMEQVSPVLAKSAGWSKPADLSGMVIGRNLMCCKTEVSVGNLVSPAGFKNCECLLQMGGKCCLCRHCVPRVALLLLCSGIQVLLGVPGALVRKRDKNKSFLWEG